MRSERGGRLPGPTPARLRLRFRSRYRSRFRAHNTHARTTLAKLIRIAWAIRLDSVEARARAFSGLSCGVLVRQSGARGAGVARGGGGGGGGGRGRPLARSRHQVGQAPAALGARPALRAHHLRTAARRALRHRPQHSRPLSKLHLVRRVSCGMVFTMRDTG
ncbi:unnamed protein product, partial [Iphiclides podalirius]